MTTRRWFRNCFLTTPFKGVITQRMIHYGFQFLSDPTPLTAISTLYHPPIRLSEIANKTINPTPIPVFQTKSHSHHASAKTSRAGNLLIRAEEHPRPERQEEGLRPPSRDANDDQVPPQGRFGADRRHSVSYPCSCCIVAGLLPSPHSFLRCASARTTTRSPT